MNLELKIIVGLSSALGIAVAGVISQNEEIKKLKKNVTRKEAIAKIFMDSFSVAASTMNEDQLIVILNKLNDDAKFYGIVHNI